MAIISAGEIKAWDLLAASDPEGICARAGVEFDPGDGTYRVPSFRRVFAVNPVERLILGSEPGGEAFLTRYVSLFRLSLLWYLLKATAARPVGKLVKPSGLPGGDIFSKGAHVLPLDALAVKYAKRPEAFLDAGAELGATPATYGNAAVVLSPLPKVPVTLLLWTEDDEFPARADLLFDVTCTAHLPLDILWSVALMSILPLLESAGVTAARPSAGSR